MARSTSTSAEVSYIPGPIPRTVRTAAGEIRDVPAGWALLLPGDATLTRRVKAAGEHWCIAERVGRRIHSRGVWADANTIEQLRTELEAERSTEGYARRKASEGRRREKVQAEYVEDFRGAVIAFLNFHPDHAEFAARLADAVTSHATPIGSGTVARTTRIPVERRAESAVIAWLRHQTTAYDSMLIARQKGLRREIRRQLAQHSRQLLARYRRGDPVSESCPLRVALKEPRSTCVSTTAAPAPPSGD